MGVGAARTPHSALSESCQGNRERKQSSLKLFAIWISVSCLLSIQILESIHNGVPWLLHSNTFKHAKGSYILQIPPKRLSKLPWRVDIVLTGIVLKDDVIIFHWSFHKSIRREGKFDTCPSWILFSKKKKIQDFTLTGSFRQKNTAVTCVKKISICFDNSVI